MREGYGSYAMAAQRTWHQRLKYLNDVIAETSSTRKFKWLTGRLQRATVEALNGMDPNLIETPRDSSTLQQAPAPDAEIIT